MAFEITNKTERRAVLLSSLLRRLLHGCAFGICLSLGAICLRPSEARACAPPMCQGGFFVPAEGEVPSSLFEIAWTPRIEHGVQAVATADHVELIRLNHGSDEEGTRIPVNLTAVSSTTIGVRPAWPFEFGERYLIRGANLCLGDGEIDETATTASFSIGPPAEFPTSLGSLDVGPIQSGNLRLMTSSGMCHSEVEAVWRDISLQPTSAAAPWVDAFLFTTEVDSERWLPSSSLQVEIPPGESWVGRGIDRIFAICQTDDPNVMSGAGEGTMQVRMNAWIPGVDGQIASLESEVVLDCDYEEPDNGDNGGGSGTSDPSGAAGDYEPEGCECSSSGPSLGLFGMILVLLALVRSRRQPNADVP